MKRVGAAGRRTVFLMVLATGLVATAVTGRAIQRGGSQAPPPAHQAPPASAGSFERDVQPILEVTCSRCHNDHRPTAGLNIAAYTSPASLVSQRDGWELILDRLRAGEMPPPGEDGPSDAALEALIDVVQTEFDRADRSQTPDPGRVTAHRLNRVEYANTVRDLLGVDVRAADLFPADDSGYGFDNNGDVLTVSPALMQAYLAAAERIASRAVGGDPLPAPGVFTRRDQVRRDGDSAIELKSVADYDADYNIRVTVTGHRGAADAPVILVISVDGKPLKTVTIPVQISAVNKQGGGTQRTVEEARVYLPGAEHVIRAEFVDDAGLQKIPVNSRRDAALNIYPELMDLAGPYPPAVPHPASSKALTCNPATGASCVTRLLTTLAHRAYRRPVTKTDVGPLVHVFEKATASDYTPAQSLQFAIARVLVSPQFLFRIERDPGPGKTKPISDVELASRLSYFLWSSMPDDALLRVAESNRLHQPEVLTAQVKRLLADSRAAAFSENFTGQWLETRSLDAVKRDAGRFPEWNAELRDAMRTETQLFVDAVVRNDRPVTDFINGKYTFVNELLAKHYRIPNVKGSQFRRIDLPDDERGGVFTQASVLTVSSYPTRTSVVLRGKFLLDNALNAPMPPPPPDVPALDEAAVGVAQSLRGQMEQHRADSFCASCHSKMDPLGFALENYDAIGRWRTMDGKFPVDSSGKLPSGHSFNGPAEMKALLVRALPDFTRGLAQKLLTYALGRGVESYDRLAVRNIVQETTASEYRMQTLIQSIVKSPPFLQRRGESVKASSDVRPAGVRTSGSE